MPTFYRKILVIAVLLGVTDLQSSHAVTAARCRELAEIARSLSGSDLNFGPGTDWNAVERMVKMLEKMPAPRPVPLSRAVTKAASGTISNGGITSRVEAAASGRPINRNNLLSMTKGSDSRRHLAKVLDVYAVQRHGSGDSETWVKVEFYDGSVELHSAQSLRRVGADLPSPETFARFQQTYGSSTDPYPPPIVQPNKRTNLAPWSDRVDDRRFPNGSAAADTMLGGGYKNDSGIPFLQDQEILQITNPTRIDVLKEQDIGQVEVGYSVYGKAIIQQQALRGCTAAVTEMLIKDRGGAINIRELYHTNLGDELSMARRIERAGFQPIQSKIQSVDDLAHAIQSNGSAIVSVGGEIGGHVVIVDEVNQNLGRVRLRDPYHGWEVTTTLEALLRRKPFANSIVQIKR